MNSTQAPINRGLRLLFLNFKIIRTFTCTCKLAHVLCNVRSTLNPFRSNNKLQLFADSFEQLLPSNYVHANRHISVFCQIEFTELGIEM